mmetsp:Transcript_25301/g.68741  ORF Transcript_25301/g.68741 Transcript_25301/m.68741 type:complete len:211 (+) Transcript_25301:1268-1900(+)
MRARRVSCSSSQAWDSSRGPRTASARTSTWTLEESVFSNSSQQSMATSRGASRSSGLISITLLLPCSQRLSPLSDTTTTLNSKLLRARGRGMDSFHSCPSCHLSSKADSSCQLPISGKPPTRQTRSPKAVWYGQVKWKVKLSGLLAVWTSPCWVSASCEARVRRRAAVLLPFAPSTEHPTRCCACGSISGEGTVEKLLCKGAGGNALLVD